MTKKTQVLIIGGGPAGLSAAIYTSRAKLKTTVIAGIRTGGQLMWTSIIENFAGFHQGIKGPQLMINMIKQAQNFGSEIDYSHVSAVDFSHQPFKIWTTIPLKHTYQELENLPLKQLSVIQQEIKRQSPNYLTNSVIVATGSVPLNINVDGEKKFLGKGISICAVCDSSFYKDKDVVVVGGGDVALEDALTLTKFAKNVTILHRKDKFKASQVMQEKVFKNKKIKILWNSQITKFIGQNKLEKIKINTNGQIKELLINGVFLAIGSKSATSIFASNIKLDEKGFIVTRKSLTKLGLELALKNLKGPIINYPSMTNVLGVFGAGDCLDVHYRQAIIAAGSGAQAGIDTANYLELKNI